MKAITLTERGAIVEICIYAFTAGKLHSSIAKRMAAAAASTLKKVKTPTESMEAKFF